MFSALEFVAAGVDLIIIYNSGRYRMAGRGSLAGLMPYGDANGIVVDKLISDCPNDSPCKLSISIPPVIARGLPESVPAWYIGPAGATISMISRRPP